LVEAGVRFITINSSLSVSDDASWDLHGTPPFPDLTALQQRIAPAYDRAYSALIADLHDRGMLETTLVCALAEFGRTPKMNPAGGRDHWPHCFTVSFAGGGVQGGRVLGRSDAWGAYPDDRPVFPPEIVATIFYSLGIDPQSQLPAQSAAPRPLVDSGYQPLRELFA
jgi:hypothetical protein